jgi:hypothetical protein
VTGWPEDRYGPAPTPAAEREAELRRIADETGETIENVRDLADALACCADEGFAEARSERWQVAREAYFDAAADDGKPLADEGDRLDVAIETAMRVRVDADIMQEVSRDRHPDIMIKTTELKSIIEVAFRAAGFEVEQ